MKKAKPSPVFKKTTSDSLRMNMSAAETTTTLLQTEQGRYKD